MHAAPLSICQLYMTTKLKNRQTTEFDPPIFALQLLMVREHNSTWKLVLVVEIPQ